MSITEARIDELGVSNIMGYELSQLKALAKIGLKAEAMDAEIEGWKPLSQAEIEVMTGRVMAATAISKLEAELAENRNRIIELENKVLATETQRDDLLYHSFEVDTTVASALGWDTNGLTFGECIKKHLEEKAQLSRELVEAKAEAASLRPFAAARMRMLQKGVDEYNHKDNIPEIESIKKMLADKHLGYTVMQLEAALQNCNTELVHDDDELNILINWCLKLTGVNAKDVVGRNGWPASLAEVIIKAVEEHKQIHITA